MPPFVTIAGANGLVGKKITKKLLESGDFDVHILVRGASVSKVVYETCGCHLIDHTREFEDAEKRGASMRSISYEGHESIVEVLQGIDVLISTVAGSALESAQVALILAAKEANVKLFIPSEFRIYFPDDKHKSLTAQAKKVVLRKAKEVGLPFAEIHTGGFPEICLIPGWVSKAGFDFENKTVTVWGDGNAKKSWTTSLTHLRWLTYVLKHVSLGDLQNKQLYIQGDAGSVDDIVSLWKRKHNEELRIEYHSIEELDSRCRAEPNDVWVVLSLEWATGRSLPDHLDNQLYEDWKPETVESTL